jgi:hypothetical protein
MKTSENVKELGIYISDCCEAEVVLDSGDTFCRCTRCAALCVWELAERVVYYTDLETAEVTAA